MFLLGAAFAIAYSLNPSWDYTRVGLKLFAAGTTIVVLFVAGSAAYSGGIGSVDWGSIAVVAIFIGVQMAFAFWIAALIIDLFRPEKFTRDQAERKARRAAWIAARRAKSS